MSVICHVRSWRRENSKILPQPTHPTSPPSSHLVSTYTTRISSSCSQRPPAGAEGQPSWQLYFVLLFVRSRIPDYPTMRRVKIFSGSSHPELTESICERLGTTPGKCDLRKFSNGETSVDIGCSIRDQDVFIVQSGSQKWVPLNAVFRFEKKLQILI